MQAERSHPNDPWGAAPRSSAGAHRGRASEHVERERLRSRPARPRSTGASAARGGAAAGQEKGTTTGIRGALAVLGVFMLTLAGAGADSFVGVGLRTLTLIALGAGTVVAAAVVRRRDLATIVVAPPLIFVGVAIVNIVLAPSATFSLPTIATLLIRGFPAMAIAVAAGLVVAVVRLLTRR